VDISHPQADEQIAAVNSVLNEIGAGDKPTMMVFNKVDQLGGGNTLARLHELYPNSVAVSARTGTGIEELLGEISTQIRPERELVELKIPHEQAALIARLHQVGQVLERRYYGKTAKFKARIPPHYHAEFAAFMVP
jgi:GTP-binding protein HflX